MRTLAGVIAGLGLLVGACSSGQKAGSAASSSTSTNGSSTAAASTFGSSGPTAGGTSGSATSAAMATAVSSSGGTRSTTAGSTGAASSTTGSCPSAPGAPIVGAWSSFDSSVANASVTLEFFPDGGCTYDYENPPLLTLGACSYSVNGSSVTIDQFPPAVDQDSGFEPCLGPVTYVLEGGSNPQSGQCQLSLTEDGGGSCTTGALDSQGYFGCQPDPAEVAPTCGAVVGACDQSATTQRAKCVDYSGTMASLLADTSCASPSVFHLGTSCNQLFPDLQQVVTCQSTSPASGVCMMEWFKNGGCQTCNLCFNSQCDAAPGSGGLGGPGPGVISCTDEVTLPVGKVSGSCTTQAQADGNLLFLQVGGEVDLDGGTWTVSALLEQQDDAGLSAGSWSCSGAGCGFGASLLGGNGDLGLQCPSGAGTTFQMTITAIDAEGDLAGTATGSTPCTFNDGSGPATDAGVLSATFTFGY